MAHETLKERFSRTVSRLGNRTAASFIRKEHVETEVSYLGLDQDANRLAHLLREWGVRQGDRAIFFLDRCLFLVVAHLAVLKLGAVGIPLNPGFKRAETAYLLGDARPNLAICGPAQAALVREIDPCLRTLVMDPRTPYQGLHFFRSASIDPPAVDVREEDPALIIYTSGTTGQPKGAILTQKNLVHDAGNIIGIWEIADTDVLCHALPLFHVHGLCFALHTAWMAGSHGLLLDGFSPETVLEILSRGIGGYTVSLFMAVPSMYSRMMDALGEERPDFSHIRLWTSGSAPLAVKDFERITGIFGKEPVEREGMTETGVNFSNPLRGTKKPGSVGLPLPGVQVRVVDPETLQDLDPGQVGERWLKGPSVTPGYWEKPEADARAFEQGWFRTGDLGKVDSDGYYHLTDRIKHIISGGRTSRPRKWKRRSIACRVCPSHRWWGSRTSGGGRRWSLPWWRNRGGPSRVRTFAQSASGISTTGNAPRK
jgi:malonyl-CoA/methylmalonyl-CoA synthetase